MTRNGSRIGVRILWVSTALSVVCGGLGAAEKARVGVADFKVVGDVGLPDAGRVVAVLLIELGPDKFDFMHAAEPAVRRERASPKYRVSGSVAKQDGLAVSARLVDAKTGKVVQTAEVRAKDARGLEAAVGELAKLLVMTDEQKKDYLARKAGKPSPAVLAELKAACTRAAAQVERDEKEHKRLSKARERGAASESEVAIGQARLGASQAAVEAAKARLAGLLGRAPGEGKARLAKAELDVAVAELKVATAEHERVQELLPRIDGGEWRLLNGARARLGLAKAKVAAAKAELAALGGPARKPATRPGRLDFSSLPKPGQRQFILDLAGLIEPADEKIIRQICGQLLTETGEPIIVVTIRSMAQHGGSGMQIGTFARLLFDRWRIGSAKTNRGILLLVAQGDRKARIELGAGWKGRKDAAARKIMDEEILRRFKKGEFSGGIVAGVKALAGMARGRP